MPPLIFEWDDENIEHIARHDVEIDEAQAVFDNKPLILRSQAGKYAAYGQSDEGRYLLVVFLRTAVGFRVITARDLTDTEKKRLRRRRK